MYGFRGFSREVAGILFGLLKEVRHGKLRLISVGHGRPGGIDALGKSVSLKRCRVHGHADVVHHRVVALRGRGHSVKSVLRGDTHNGRHIRRSLHRLCRKVKCPLLIKTAALEQSAHLIEVSKVIALRNAHVLIGVGADLLKGLHLRNGGTGRFIESGNDLRIHLADVFTEILEYALRTAEVLLKFAERVDDVFSEFDRGGTRGNTYRADRRTDFFQHVAKTGELVLCVIRRVSGVIYAVIKLSGFVRRGIHIFCHTGRGFSRIIKSGGSLVKSGIIAVKLTLHFIEGGFRVVQLYLPALSTSVGIAERFGGVCESGTKGLYFFLLRFDLFVQNVVSCG